MPLIQVKDIIKKSYNDLKMVSSYLDEICAKQNDRKIVRILSNMKGHIDEMSFGIQEFITANDSPELDTWLQYVPELQDISEVIAREAEDLDEKDIISTAIKINKAFKENFELLSKMNMPEKVIAIFLDIRDFSQKNCEREHWNQAMNRN